MTLLFYRLNHLCHMHRVHHNRDVKFSMTRYGYSVEFGHSFTEFDYNWVCNFSTALEYRNVNICCYYKKIMPTQIQWLNSDCMGVFSKVLVGSSIYYVLHLTSKWTNILCANVRWTVWIATDAIIKYAD